MPASNSSWGIEIGAYAVKALKLALDGTDVRVVDFVVIPHAKVLSTPGADANDVLRVSLGTLVSQFDLTGASIAVSVPGHSAFARFAKLPPVEPKKVPDIVKFEAMQQIPFPLEEVEWDYQTFVSPDSPDVEVGIFAMTKEKISERLSLLQDVNINPDYVTLSPIAAFNALAYDLEFSESTPGTVIVDVGTTSTDLVVAEAGRVWVRTFPLGGHQFTDALVNAFKLGYPKAEKLKLEAEESKHARHVFQAMRPVFTDLAQDIQRSIGYYQSLHKDAKLTRLIGLGSTFHLPGLRKYLKQQLGIEVYRIEEFKRLKLDRLPEAQGDAAALGTRSKFQESSINLVTAYGLALQGLEMETIGANLMPVSVVREAMWRRKVKWFGLAAGLGVAAAAAMFIRPVMDHYAVAAMDRPPEIDQTISRAEEQKRIASDAGVISTAESDFRPANMVRLLERREVYAHLVNDLGMMMADANAKAATWKGPEGSQPVPPPAFQLQSFRTRYVEPGAGATSDDPNAPPPESSPDDLGRVRVTLEVRTALPDPQRFVISSLQEWITKNAQRSGIPYKLVTNKQPPWSVQLIEAPKPEASAEAGRGEGEGDVRRSPRDRRVAPADRRRERDEPLLIPVEQQGAGEQANSIASFEAMKKSAAAPPDTAVVTLEWEAVLVPPPTPTEGENAGGEQNQGGGQ
ncbi:MAG: type IV pilus assembly protein PilM [Planctomycetota bacterium]|nr:type IV pilus assembly protein PilM [Planctomycetota bacterium]